MSSVITHGSPAGFADGCRTRAMCPNGDLSPWLSCAEASVQRRSDYRLWKLPLDQPIPRASTSSTLEADPAEPQAPSDATDDAAGHGSLGGYRRGCHVDRLCPNWTAGRTTCAGARRKYIREYRARRYERDAGSIPHGTLYGYYLGCRDRRTCPGSQIGETCSDAQARRKREIASAAGIAPKVDPVDSALASQRIWELQAQGLSLREIARLTGCGHTTISDLARRGTGRRTRVNPDTLRRILEVSVLT